MLQGRHRARQGGDYREVVGEHGRHAVAGFANADHRLVGQATGCIQAGIVKAGDDYRIMVRMLANGLQQACQAEGFVIVALDGGRAVGRSHSHNFGAR